MSLLASNNMLLAAQHRGIIVPDGLFFYLPMGTSDIVFADTGSEVKDRSGNGYDGATSNMDASNIVTAPFNNALSFNGVDELSDHGDDIGMTGLTAFSINWWQRWRPTASGGRIFSQWNTGGTKFRLSLTGASFDKIQFALRDPSDNERSANFYVLADDAAFYDDGVMRMYTVIWGGGADIEAYLSGTELLIRSNISPTSVPSLASSVEHMVISAKWNGGAPINFLDSDIGEVRFYNRVLTEQDRIDLYALGA